MLRPGDLYWLSLEKGQTISNGLLLLLKLLASEVYTTALATLRGCLKLGKKYRHQKFEYTSRKTTFYSL